VFLLYRLGAALLNAHAAIAASIFLAVAPLHVRDSHYVKHDVPATLAIVAAYLAMSRVWPNCDTNEPTARTVVIAGALTGLALSTHYYCVFLALPLAWTIFQGFKAHGASAVMRHLALGGAASAVLFLAASPFLAMEPSAAWRDVVANREIVVDRAVQSGAFTPAFRYADILWRDSMGWPVVALGVAGAAWMLRSSPARAVQLLAFPVPFLLFVANTAPASRYLNPVLPFVALFAASLLSRGLGHMPRPLFWTCVFAAALPGAVASIRADHFFRQADTRTLARKFIESHIPPESTIAVQPYSVPLTPSRTSLTEALSMHLGSSAAASTKFQLQLSLDPYPAPAYRLTYLGSGGLDVDKIYVGYEELARSGLEPLRRLGVAFVVVKRYNTADPATLAFLTSLAREGRLVAAFSPYRPGVSKAEQARIDPFLHNTDTRIDDALERPGPPLEIWQIDGSESTIGGR
jgi:hypothetical protein